MRAAALLALLLASGCTDLVYRAALPFLYEYAPLPSDRIVRDLPYRADAAADPQKHRLDLFRAEGSGWPVLVFVHGGWWTEGDRALIAGGADVYSNIGRFFATRGVGVAVISYRLQPAVGWRDQIDDVAHAVAWVQREIASYGGAPDAVFLAGHSAGAQLIERVGLDRAALERAGATPAALCGLIPVSGLGFDLTDAKTYALGLDEDFVGEHFRDVAVDGDWRVGGSVVGLARADAPPSLILYAEGDGAPLRRQSDLLHQRLQAAGAASQLVIVPGESHPRMVLALSRPNDVTTSSILAFIRTHACGRVQLPG